jgi:hypothetical protein
MRSFSSPFVLPYNVENRMINKYGAVCRMTDGRDRAITQAVSSQLPTAAAWVCGGQSGT